MEMIQLENEFTSRVYAKHPIVLVRGQGAVLWDEAGREYIDCSAGHGSVNLGHVHPVLVSAIKNQVETLISCPEAYYNDQRAAYLSRLTSVLPPGLNRVFLSNSGTEAVEAAIKFARFSTKRTQVVAAMRGFHGRTMGALSATWNKRYRTPFEPLVPDFVHVPFNKVEALEEAITENTAALILEVVQGEAGVYPADKDYLAEARRLCDERGALLIFDEVQTGFGRTGKLFAFQHHNIQPDMLCLAKSIAGGIPMGATVLGERVAPLEPGIHGSTFGGNPLACAAANAVLDVMENEALPENAAEIGAYLLESLQALDSSLIREVRGVGLMIGIELKEKAAPHSAALLAQGVITVPAGLTTIRLLPPLVITRQQAERVVAAVSQVLGD